MNAQEFRRVTVSGDKIAPGVRRGKVRQARRRAQMLTSALGGILGIIFYGGLAVVSMYLMGQLLPVFYVFVSEGL